MVSTVDVNAVGLGTAILYQSYFVCLKETSKSTVIEYGKSLSTTESGDVYLTMLDRDDPLFVRFYSFGNGEKPLQVVDAHIVSRRLTQAKCRGDTMRDNQTNICVQHCHELCDPFQGIPFLFRSFFFFFFFCKLDRQFFCHNYQYSSCEKKESVMSLYQPSAFLLVLTTFSFKLLLFKGAVSWEIDGRYHDIWPKFTNFKLWTLC